MGKSEGLGEGHTSVSDVVIIDVREKYEWNLGHVPEAIHIPVGSIRDQITTAVPDKNAKIGVYCAAGIRAGTAKQALCALGYRNVRNLGGFGTVRKAIDAIRT
jgi:rhodanese-related sulfurtransferase